MPFLQVKGCSHGNVYIAAYRKWRNTVFIHRAGIYLRLTVAPHKHRSPPDVVSLYRPIGEVKFISQELSPSTSTYDISIVYSQLEDQRYVTMPAYVTPS